MKQYNKLNQKKFKRKYQIFSNELEGISLNNWKANIVSLLSHTEEYGQLDEIPRLRDGGN